jgi:hypothetical protein
LLVFFTDLFLRTRRKMTLPYAYFERKHAKRGCGNPSKKGYYGCVDYSKLYHDLNDAWLSKSESLSTPVRDCFYREAKTPFRGKRSGAL